MEIRFIKDKETKNTIRFKEVENLNIIPTIYINKEALKEINFDDGDTIIIQIRKE